MHQSNFRNAILINWIVCDMNGLYFAEVIRVSKTWKKYVVKFKILNDFGTVITFPNLYKQFSFDISYIISYDIL